MHVGMKTVMEAPSTKADSVNQCFCELKIHGGPKYEGGFKDANDNCKGTFISDKDPFEMQCCEGELASSSMMQYQHWHVGSCQKYDPLLGPLNTKCRIVLRTQKGTTILTTTHVMQPQGRLQHILFSQSLQALLATTTCSLPDGTR